MFDRLEALIGKDKLNLINNKNIIIFGVGGVGGYVAEALARSGIENLTIVDGDIIDESNLNRQIIALRSTIGMKKVDVLSKRLLDINPSMKIKTVCELVEPGDIEKYNLKNYDYIIDCIDDVKVKVSLSKYSLKNETKLVISTGTAKKLHPEKLKITTLDKTCYDPLARKMRELLKGENIKRLVVLASDEEPIKTDNSVLGSSAFVPSSGGLLIASYVINDIIS